MHKFLLLLLTNLACFSLLMADQEEDLALKLANPVANLVSIPIQANYDQNIGPRDEGSIWRINVQPVIPFELNDEWNLITRTIVPIIDQADIPQKGAGKSGLGDITASQFFSPKAPTANGWIWGAGPVWLLPTATSNSLGARKWGLGPTAVFLKQENGLTYGALVNHMWSFAGKSDRPYINASFMQPFISLTTESATTFALSLESTYDWRASEWAVPVNLTVGQLIPLGKMPVSLTAGVRYWLDSAKNGPEGWGFRLAVTLLLPK